MVVIALVCVLASVVNAYATHNPIVVIVPSYNNEKWCEQNMYSLLAQDYDAFRILYIDDCSSDKTHTLVAEYAAKHAYDVPVDIIVNTQRRGALANIYTAVHACADDEIIVLCDGDDCLHGTDALTTINQAYQDQQVWMTYGQYQTFPKNNLGVCNVYSNAIKKRNAYRYHPWLASHPRTFYAWLFKKIKQEDLMHEGDFFDVTWDMALMFPMLEMAAGRVRFINKVMYNYNVSNPLNDFRQKLRRVYACERIIRNKEPYAPLADCIV